MPAPMRLNRGIQAHLDLQEIRGLVLAAKGRLALSRLVLQCWLQPGVHLSAYAEEMAQAARSLRTYPGGQAKADFAERAARALLADVERRKALRGKARDREDELRAAALMISEWGAAENRIIHDFARRLAEDGQSLPGFEEAADLYEVYPVRETPRSLYAREAKSTPSAYLPPISSQTKPLTLAEQISSINDLPQPPDARLLQLQAPDDDRVAGMDLAQLEAEISPSGRTTIQSALWAAGRRKPDPSLIAAALRWAVRGLRPHHAARKAWLDRSYQSL